MDLLVAARMWRRRSRRRYKAYGAIAQSSGASTPTYLGYAGQLLDPSGLFYLRARWYDPATGRFVSRDPVGPDPSVPASLNAFGYGHASPTMLSDPTGACPFCSGLEQIIEAAGHFVLGMVASPEEADIAVAASQSDDVGVAITGNVELFAAAVLGVAAAAPIVYSGWGAFRAYTNPVGNAAAVSQFRYSTHALGQMKARDITVQQVMQAQQEGTQSNRRMAQLSTS